MRALEQELVEMARDPRASFPESPFGTTETGAIDLRGARLTTPVKYARARDIDLSDVAFVGASVTESELESCILDKIDMRSTFVGRRFTACGFVNAKLTGARLGGVFSDCDFSGATLSRSVASGATFERCVFTGASLNAVLWTTRCVFDGVSSLTGSVAGSIFRGTAPDDLSGLIVDGMRFEEM